MQETAVQTIDGLEAVVSGIFSPLGKLPYKQVLPRVQSEVSLSLKRQVEDLTEAELKGIISRHLRDHQIKCDLTNSAAELTNYIYHDMAGLSFISREKILEQDGFEELDINAWDDVEIIIRGKREKTDYRFLSPEHASDIILKILRKTQTAFDVAEPGATADLGSGMRITALRAPLVDENVSVSASIRKVDMTAVGRKKLVGATLTEQMMTFLELCLTHGVSIAFSGETGAGKTSLAGCLLSHAAKTLRIYTIEEGSREWDFVQRDENGKVTNSVIHTRTRPNKKDSTQNIGQEELVKYALRFNPDIIAPGEIRGREAFEVMGVSNTGHTVMTTVHSNGTLDTPERIITLAKKAYDMTDATLFSMCARAFPLLVHMEQNADRQRRVTEIREVTGCVHGEIQSHLLFEFDIQDNVYEGDRCIRTEGSFRQLAPISHSLAKQMLKKGARRSELQQFLEVEHGQA
ncbi:MAG: ATPase, T2SS/T4P/T4SS family [Oscillibacter sp.]|nr:ATPase, T2SS/T4P/T4SS family [Oscillibacter sp.]MEA4993930.1 ATPase, T2SS/T4P/T4SS family [Oscillibacter sp.]